MLTVIVLLASQVACDSQEPEKVVPNPQIRFTWPLPDTVTYLGYDPTEISLRSFVALNSAVRDVTFEVRVIDGAAAVGADGWTLSLGGSSLGSSTVVVEAKGTPGGYAADTLSLLTSNASIQFARPIPDGDVYVGEGPLTIDLHDSVVVNPTDVSISFEAEPLTDGPISIGVDDWDLTVQGMTLGTTAVVVRARGENGEFASDTFSVRSRDPCPQEEGPAGYVGVFPVSVGSVWTYASRLIQTPPPGTHTSTTRTSHSVAVGEDLGCQSGARRLRVRITETDSSGSVSQSYDTVWSVTSDSVLTEVPTFSRGDIESAEPPPFLLSAPRFVPEAELDGTDEVTYRRYGGPRTYAETTLRRGVGPVEYLGFGRSSVSGRYNTTVHWTRTQ